jgi:hypothetical protein
MCTRVTDEAYAYALTLYMAWCAMISDGENRKREEEELISMGRLFSGRLQIFFLE